MNLLFITDNFYPEGNAIASRVYERACYWVKWGHDVTVITSAPNFPEGKLQAGYKNKWFQKEIIQGIHVIRVKTLIKSNTGFFLRILDFLSFMPTAFLAGLFYKKPDVVLATSPQFFGAITACVLAKLKRVSFTLEIGDLWPASIVSVGAMRESAVIRFLEKLELLLYRHSNTIIVVSPAFKKNLIARKVPTEKIFTVMNGVDLSKYSPIPYQNTFAEKYGIKNKFTVGYIGTHGMAHGLSHVLEAAKLLHSKDIQFVFVGSGAEKQSLIEKANQLNLTNVIFIPAQPKDSIKEAWSICNLALVHFKNSETFSAAIPSKIFEAMGMGLPILLAAPKGAASNLITAEKVGLSIPAENPPLLVDAILQLYHNPNLLSQFAENSLTAAKFHTREKQAEDFISVIKERVSLNTPNVSAY